MILRLVFRRVPKVTRESDNPSGTPPFYVCETWVDNGIKNISYISASNVLPVVKRDFNELETHTVFATYDQICKPEALRTVLQMAAVIYPTRFTAPNSASPDLKDMLQTLNSVIRIGSMIAGAMG